MAEDDLDLADGDGEDAPKKEMSVKKLIIILSSVFTLVLIVVVVSLVLLLKDDPAPATAAPDGEVSAEESSKKEDDEKEDAKKEKASDGVKKSKGSAIFYRIRPAFVVNFQNPKRAKYLQVNVEVMARSEDAIEAVEEYLPIIKNDLISLFSRQTYDMLSTSDGKELLRKDALAVIQAVLERETGSPGIESVLFTSFVMQ